jgi:hypothetical protein
MKPPHFSALALLLLVTTASAMAQQQDAQKSEPSGTVVAQRSVRVYWDAGSQPPDIGTILDLLFSRDVAGKLGEKVLGVPPDVVMQGQIGATVVKVEQNSFSFDFTVNLEPRAGAGPTARERGMRPAAKELADALTAHLSTLLADYREQQARPQLQLAEIDAAEAKEELDKLHQQLARVQEELRQHSGRTDVSPEGVQAAMTKLEDERQRLELELAGMTARLEEVQYQHERAERSVKARAQDDPIAGELETAVATRKNVLDLTRKRFEAGADASQRDVADAEAAYIDAKVQLLERRAAAAASSAGGSSLSALNDQLQALAIDTRDRQARLKYVNERLKPLRNAPDLITQYQNLESSRQRVLRQYDEAQSQLRAARRQTRGVARDRVVVTDSLNQPTAKEEGKKNAE